MDRGAWWAPWGHKESYVSEHMHVLPMYVVLCGLEKLSLLMTIQVGKGTR